VPDAEETLRSAYRAFNARDIDAAIELMHAEVDWPNAWEGGRVVGREAVRGYWSRQFAAISSNLEPEGVSEESDGSITVDVHQVVHEARTGKLISDSRVCHRYRLEDGLIVRMDVLDHPDLDRSSSSEQRQLSVPGSVASWQLNTRRVMHCARILDVLHQSPREAARCRVREAVRCSPSVNAGALVGTVAEGNARASRR
jgi:ketosteroid isomerase-like protein